MTNGEIDGSLNPYKSLSLLIADPLLLPQVVTLTVVPVVPLVSSVAAVVLSVW